MGARRTLEQKELLTGMGMGVGGSEKPACPESTSASWIAKVRRKKMRQNQRHSEVMKEFENQARSLFSMQWPLPSLLKGKGKKIGSCSFLSDAYLFC